jgi:hypothetical protein
MIHIVMTISRLVLLCFNIIETTNELSRFLLTVLTLHLKTKAKAVF